jgi:hypothetical protein
MVTCTQSLISWKLKQVKLEKTSLYLYSHFTINNALRKLVYSFQKPQACFLAQIYFSRASFCNFIRAATVQSDYLSPLSKQAQGMNLRRFVIGFVWENQWRRFKFWHFGMSAFCQKNKEREHWSFQNIHPSTLYIIKLNWEGEQWPNKWVSPWSLFGYRSS